MQIPDYFLALMKQYGNLMSNQEAKYLVNNLSSSLYMNLDELSRKHIFDSLPAYLKPKKQLFGHRLHDNEAKFDIQRFIRQAMITSGLTDENELAAALRAYFKTIKVLSDRDHTQVIADNLPAGLHSLFAKC